MPTEKTPRRLPPLSREESYSHSFQTADRGQTISNEIIRSRPFNDADREPEPQTPSGGNCIQNVCCSKVCVLGKRKSNRQKAHLIIRVLPGIIPHECMWRRDCLHRKCMPNTSPPPHLLTIAMVTIYPRCPLTLWREPGGFLSPSMILYGRLRSVSPHVIPSQLVSLY